MVTIYVADQALAPETISVLNLELDKRVTAYPRKKLAAEKRKAA